MSPYSKPGELLFCAQVATSVPSANVALLVSPLSRSAKLSAAFSEPCSSRPFKRHPPFTLRKAQKYEGLRMEEKSHQGAGRKFFRGSVLGITDQVLRMSMALVITPLMVAHLGVARYGVWALVTAFVGQYVMLDFGLGASLPRFMAAARGRGDEAELKRVASTGFCILCASAMVCAVITGALWMLMPRIVADAALREEARAVLAALGVATIITLATRVFVVHLQGQLRADVLHGVAIVRVVLCSAAAIWTLLHGGGLRELALIHAAGALVESLVLVIVARDLMQHLRLAHVTRASAEEITRYSGWSYAHNAGERLRAGLDPFIVGGVLGSAAAGVYVLGSRLGSTLYDTAYALIGGQLLPAFSHLHAAGRREELERGFLTMARISALLAALGAGLVCVVGPAFLKCWVPGQAEEAVVLMFILVAPFTVYAAQMPSVHLVFSMAKHRALALAGLAALVLNLVLSIVLTRMIGIRGAAIGTAVDLLLLHGVVLPWLVIHFSGLSWSAVAWRGLWLPLLRGLLLFLPAAWFAFQGWHSPSWWWVAVTIAALSAWYALAVMAGLAGKEAQRLARALCSWALGRATLADVVNGHGLPP